MKKIILFAILAIATFGAKAQSFKVINNSSCDFEFNILASDPSNPCYTIYPSAQYPVLGGGGIVTFSSPSAITWQSGGTPTSVHYDVFQGNAVCSGGGAESIGGCPAYPSSGTFNWTSCSPCASHTFTMTWTSSGGNVTVTITN